MDSRHLVALGFFLLILAILGWALRHASRDWRAERRSDRGFARQQKARRADDVRTSSDE
jgi:hypothetical protein